MIKDAFHLPMKRCILHYLLQCFVIHMKIMEIRTIVNCAKTRSGKMK